MSADICLRNWDVYLWDGWMCSLSGSASAVIACISVVLYWCRRLLLLLLFHVEQRRRGSATLLLSSAGLPAAAARTRYAPAADPPLRATRLSLIR